MQRGRSVRFPSSRTMVRMKICLEPSVKLQQDLRYFSPVKLPVLIRWSMSAHTRRQRAGSRSGLLTNISNARLSHKYVHCGQWARFQLVSSIAVGRRVVSCFRTRIIETMGTVEGIRWAPGNLGLQASSLLPPASNGLLLFHPSGNRRIIETRNLTIASITKLKHHTLCLLLACYPLHSPRIFTTQSAR